MTFKQKTLAVIGFGSFGQLIAVLLKNHFKKTVAFNRSNKSKEAEKLGIEFQDFSKISQLNKTDIVILCVSISSIPEILKLISKNLKKSAIVIDACSVKINPAKQMLEILPKTVELIGSHPMFGPQSVKTEKDLIGKTIVLCDLRSQNFIEFKEFFESLGLNVIISTPEEHDKAMAESQALFHFIAKAVNSENLMKDEKFFTASCKLFEEALRMVENDSEELFKDMQLQNPFTKQARKKFLEKAIEVDSSL